MENRSPAGQVWTHPNLEVRDSPVAGRGLFARQEIKVLETVVRFGGRLVTTDELAELFALAEATGHYVDTIQVETDSHLVLPEGSAAHFGNHSCDPNLWYDSEFVLSARRDIARGEEATVDYATFSAGSGFSMACQCGAPSCRRQVDWRRLATPPPSGTLRRSLDPGDPGPYRHSALAHINTPDPPFYPRFIRHYFHTAPSDNARRCESTVVIGSEVDAQFDRVVGSPRLRSR